MAAHERDRQEVSVVVCTRDGEHRLGSTLAALQRQSLEASRYEVIVVDDGSTDRTAQVAESSGARVVRLRPSRGLAAARNAGTAAAGAAIVAFTDDDCDPAEDWLEAMLSAFANGSPDGASGVVIPSCANRFLLGYLRARNPLVPLGIDFLASSRSSDRLRRYLHKALGRDRVLHPGAELYSLVGANMALRRESIVELGGFDEAIRFGGEEEDLCRCAHSTPRGAVFRYHPSAAVMHRFDSRLRDSVRRARAYGRARPYASRKHQDMKLIVYPFPVLAALAGAAALGPGRRRRLGLALLAPIAAYARWPFRAWRSRSLAPLLYAYLELSEEAATMVGELEGLYALRRQRARRRR
jgi:glycosyltransferase involved in cell wall biosynthesis